MRSEISGVTRAELPELARAEALCFPRPGEPWPEAVLVSQLPDERHIFLSARENGALRGYLALSHVADEGEITRVAVLPAFRRRGIADALLSAAAKKAAALGLDRVYLELRESNAPALRLYEKHGFEITGRRKGYYRPENEDALLMTLFLRR